VDKLCTLFGYYKVYSGNSLLKFWDNTVVPSSRVKKSKKKASIPLNREMRSWRQRQTFPMNDVCTVKLFSASWHRTVKADYICIPQGK
jgi:hypothetical protein